MFKCNATYEEGMFLGFIRQHPKNFPTTPRGKALTRLVNFSFSFYWHPNF